MSWEAHAVELIPSVPDRSRRLCYTDVEPKLTYQRPGSGVSPAGPSHYRRSVLGPSQPPLPLNRQTSLGVVAERI